ncbi:MAG TPA: ATPase, T2SS/T4P/T4SS family [Candidatus Hydrogenedentes bacterium]|nr:ATPase, T2SS/T4P/T4SS family [Candidatus Hydrogenedentota bacterium]HOL77884.1 ATPase, T2SS/T4P/T4SS family [Candidatus Hydrogenedentota bacterium]HPO87049.1 ATPase, T2SS/T4P/T4SS family [Candidatus Hydrogenedentota bacterium]
MKKKQTSDIPILDAGEELVKRDIITREELDEARRKEQVSGVPWYRQLLQTHRIGFDLLDDILHHEFHPRSKREEHERLGATLLAMKAITENDLKEALKEQNRTGRLLGNILLDSGKITRRTIVMALAKQNGLEYADVEKTPSQRAAIEAVPESVARRNQMIPVRLEGDRLTVLIADPGLRQNLKETSILLGLRIYPMLTTIENIKEEIAKRYRGENLSEKPPTPSSAKEEKVAAPITKSETISVKEESKQTEKKKGKKTMATPQEPSVTTAEQEKPKLRFEELAREASGMPVVKLVQTIIEGAAKAGATDIHLDPQEPEMRVRYRIDGILHDVMSIAREIEPAVISRIKIMSDLDITETRRPQDGHISLEVAGNEYDIRVATLPTYLGERVVLRMLDQSSVLQGIKDLGLEPEDEETLLRLIEQPYGMILVTGPTGSGKTTTLYAALNQKNVVEESIVTLEDPVEYQLSGINQVQIDPDIDMTFANVLRAALRQDIDVLLVGEIRDPETARIAIRAAMTGHLVFSTMHTNDAPEAISTLRNMGVPSYLIASALTAVLAQRLVRKICLNCKQEFKPDKMLLQSVGLPPTVKQLWRGKGCDVCYHTGNKGRTGIFEIIEVTPEIRKMIAEDRPVDEIAKAAKLKTMADRCRLKMKAGIVAPEEFLRVIRT